MGEQVDGDTAEGTLLIPPLDEVAAQDETNDEQQGREYRKLTERIGRRPK